MVSLDVAVVIVIKSWPSMQNDELRNSGWKTDNNQLHGL